MNPFVLLLGLISCVAASFNLTLSQKMYELDVARFLECMADCPIPFTVALNYHGDIAAVPAEGFNLNGTTTRMWADCLGTAKHGSIIFFGEHYDGVYPYAKYDIHDDPRGPIGFSERGVGVYYGSDTLRKRYLLRLRRAFKAVDFPFGVEFSMSFNLTTT